MKYLISILIIFFAFVENVNAQWDLGGNLILTSEYIGAQATSSIPVQFKHFDNSSISRFEWYTNDGSLLERMRLTQAGFLGINTASPSMRFHVHNGGILSTGTTGTNPDLGAGTVLMWIPDAQAFRAGTAVGTEWNSSDVGTNSFAFGEELTASGDYSVSFGENNVSSNTASFSGGLNNTSQGLHSFTYGINNTATGNSSIAVGDSNETVGLRSIPVQRDLQSRCIISGSPEPTPPFPFDLPVG